MIDLEAQEPWLERLRSLNEVIAATGESLVGNLFYQHLQRDFVSSRPHSAFKLKRERFRRALAGRSRMLEVGVNGGHSAYLALTSNPKVVFHGVDICEHAYVRPVVEWLQAEFPGRVHLHPGDSLSALSQLQRERHRFDCFHIDGAKHTYYEDIINCQRMVEGDGAVIVVDDSNTRGVTKTWRRCLRQGVIEPLADFPAMASTERFQNQIGLLRPKRSALQPTEFFYVRAITVMERGRSFLAQVRRAIVGAR